MCIRDSPETGYGPHIGAGEAALRQRIAAHQFLYIGVELFKQALEQGIKQRILRREVMQQPALADTGGGGDRIERDRGHAFAGSKARRDIQQLLAHKDGLLLAMVSVRHAIKRYRPDGFVKENRSKPLCYRHYVQNAAAA